MQIITSKNNERIKEIKKIRDNKKTRDEKMLYIIEGIKMLEEAIKEVVDYYIENPPAKTKYYFGDQSLHSFCDKNGYSYIAIHQRISKLKKDGNYVDNALIVEEAIKKYEDKLNITKINDVFNNLKLNKKISEEEIVKICEFLKISYENVKDLNDMGFNYNQAINMIWYFSDNTIDDYKVITDNKIGFLFEMIENFHQKTKKGK